MSSYAAGSCEDARAAEPGFVEAMDCAKACEHRKSCVEGASDLGSCMMDCTALQYDHATLDKYIKADCSYAKQSESGFKQASACMKGCKHALDCKLNGTLAGCLSMCTEGMRTGKMTAAFVEEMTTADCETVKKKVTLTPPAAPRGRSASGSAPAPAGGGGGRTGQQCRQGTGIDDCPYLKMCCNRLCLSPGICYIN